MARKEASYNARKEFAAEFSSRLVPRRRCVWGVCETEATDMLRSKRQCVLLEAWEEAGTPIEAGSH